MRITKDPEERRQEIIETAMLLFYENGYEKHRLEILRRQSEWHRDYVSLDRDDGRCALYLCWHRIRPLSGKSLLYYHDADQRKRHFDCGLHFVRCGYDIQFQSIVGRPDVSVSQRLDDYEWYSIS